EPRPGAATGSAAEPQEAIETPPQLKRATPSSATSPAPLAFYDTTGHEDPSIRSAGGGRGRASSSLAIASWAGPTPATNRMRASLVRVLGQAAPFSVNSSGADVAVLQGVPSGYLTCPGF